MPGVTSTTQRLERVVREDGQVLGRNSGKAVPYDLNRLWHSRPRFRGFRVLAASRKTELTANKMATMIRKLIPTPQ